MTSGKRPANRAAASGTVASSADRSGTDASGAEGFPAGTLRVAVVYSCGDILFAAAALSDPALHQRLGEYVRERAGITLWPADARRVSEHLADGRSSEAVAAYFAAVGERWDPEQLHIRTIEVCPGAGGSLMT